jgi:hypothetical protein
MQNSPLVVISTLCMRRYRSDWKQRVTLAAISFLLTAELNAFRATPLLQSGRRRFFLHLMALAPGFAGDSI